MTLDEDLDQKLQQALNKLLVRDFNIASVSYTDILLTQIIKKVEEGNKQVLVTIKKWISTAVNTWDDVLKPCQSIGIFTVKLTGLISANEINFLTLANKDVYNKIYFIFEFERKNLSVSMKLASTSFCKNLLEHNSGRKWIAESGAWKIILNHAQLNHTMYLTKESQIFLSELLIKESHNQNLCTEIIMAVTQPLINATINSDDGNHPYTFDEQVLVEQSNLLLTTLELLLAIMEYTTFHDLENPIPKMFEDLTSLESRVKVVFEVSISTPFVKTVHKLSKLLVFCKLRSSLQASDNMEIKVFEQFCLGLCYNSNMLLSKKYILDLVVSKKLGVIYWKKLKKLKNIEVPPPFKFEIQAVALMILPLCVTMKPNYIKKHYLFEEYIEKLFSVTCTPVQRLCYSIRDVILKNDFPMEYICKSTIDHLLEIMDIIDRESAVIIFQTVCHALANFVTLSDPQPMGPRLESPERPSFVFVKRREDSKAHFLDGDPINDKQMLLSALLNCLNVLTDKFKLKWTECVETICILSIAEEILNHPGVDFKICILALKTCKLAVQNYMPPNLALLVDFDDQTKQIGPTLFKRMHDTHWEVQDSVLEILYLFASHCESKYPPYQQLILENSFLTTAIDLAKEHSDSYVRASALKFVAQAIHINTLWEKVLHKMKLEELALKLVCSESEAIVRREAAVMVTELYIHRSWSKEVTNLMSRAMAIAVVLDLDWEVKVYSLEFWRHFIKSHLTDQGMLDNYFPSFTFSKEHRKIVSLNETEIKQRLIKALDELSRKGCLGVLLKSLKDESDLPVAKASASIIEDLRRTLLHYKINEPVPELPLPKDSAIIDTNYVKRPTPSSTDSTSAQTAGSSTKVIEEIVDAQDESLLASIYSDSKCINDTEVDKTRNEMLECVSKITREEFLRTILNYDLKAYIEGRETWLQNYMNSFESALDDILLISNKKDINSMDCY